MTNEATTIEIVLIGSFDKKCQNKNIAIRVYVFGIQ